MGITKFIIFNNQRSGSTWLVDMLNSHPEIIVYSELFLRNVKKDKPTLIGEKDIFLRKAYLKKSKGIFNRFRPFSCFRYLGYIYSVKKSVNAIGFKLLYDQFLYFPEILVYLLLNKISVVHLIRSNILDVILSREAVSIRRSFHSFDNVGKVQVNLNTSNLLNKLRRGDRRIKLAKRLFSGSGLPYIEVEYEELISNPLLTYTKPRYTNLPATWKCPKRFRSAHRQRTRTARRAPNRSSSTGYHSR